MGTQGIVVPFLEYGEIGGRADEIIDKHHPSRELPIPVEEIIDPGMGISIFPLPGLTRATEDDDGIVAYINSALDTITVDDSAYKRQSPRYRFSIAHELGHIVMHQAIFPLLRFDTVAEWKRVQTEIPQREYRWLDWQAHAFAGHLLVPTTELQAALSEYLAVAEAQGIDPRDDSVRLFAEKYLGDTFRASAMVLHIRIEKEDLWPV